MVSCPSCGKGNPDGFAFCGFCGGALDTSTAPILEERKVVSILFCDLVGFTADSERQDPEDVRARLRPYHARLRQEIERFGGTVEKFVGDAVMAVYGAPVAHEDDAERAVRSGLRILGAIAELNDSAELGLRVRIGINTGEAVVAVGASPERGEGLVTGDVVNTASRIESVAPVNGVAVSEQTYRTTSHVFEYEPLEPVAVKGKAEPLSLWRAKAVRIRFGTDFHDHATPFVGREFEKPLLIGIYERAMQRRAPQLVTIVGEPGVGKSRMVAELFAYVDAKPEIVRWRQGRCLPYGEGITFWALGEIVKREAAILESDSSQVALQKLEAALAADLAERRWLIQRLAPLVGVETGTPAERQESFTAWRRYLEGLAAARETVLVFEDLHWGDDALLDFIEHLAEWAEDVPLLVICSARPELYERRPGWAAGQRNSHTINLAPLSDEETAELVAHLVAATMLTPELRQAILERAGGNPLYAEEFVRLLSDRGLAVDEMVLPESVQALIAARLDTLPPERKSLLQDAAVLGKVFWASAVAEMGGLDEDDVELALHELARKELVRPARTSSMEGESEYAFWHLLVRDVAYAQIPRTERSRRHRAAAAWIERKAGERVEDLAEVLAHHYLLALELAAAAGNPALVAELVEPARRFLVLAGDRALGLDTAQAEARLARALELTPAGDPEWPRLLTRWADAALQHGHTREGVDALDETIPVLLERGEREAAATALQLRSRASLRLGDGRSVAFAAEAVKLLENDPPGPTHVAAYAQLASATMLAGSYRESIAAAEEAIRIASVLGLPDPARARGYRGYARAYLGAREGIEEMTQALDALLELGAGREAAVLQNNRAIARYPLEGVASALAAFEEGIEFCEERGLVEATLALGGNCPGLLIELGRVNEGLERAERLDETYEARENTHDRSEVRAAALVAKVARGEPDLAEADWLVDVARQLHSADLTPFALGAAAAAYVATDPDRSRSILREIEGVAGTRETPYYARHLPLMVRTSLAVGDRDLAERLVHALEPRYPLEEHALCSARALLAEEAGDLGKAAALYAQSATRWQEFGNVPERAYALLGQGRCLRALGRRHAEEALLEARELFASMGYAPALAEVDRLLQHAPVTGAS